VAGLEDEAVTALLLEDRAAVASAGFPVSSAEPGDQIDQVYARILAFDARGLEKILWRAAMTLGARRFVDDLVGPLLTRVGLAWRAGELSPSQEHMGSEVVDRILERLTEPSRSSDGPKLIVATLPGERHGLGARLVSTSAVLEGWSVTYLGTDLPEVEIVAAAEAIDAVAVAISAVSHEDLGKTIGSLATLRELLDPSVDILLGGGAAASLGSKGLPDGVTLLDGLAGFRELSKNQRSPRLGSTRGATQ
jgi:methanogenic corrinoid protein MtbC1